ncbi:MAG TPA: phosphoglycolate phosphatase [Alphaproteobacteria bacterium]|nr:phosphoglycolate phosphatase [Alphaproteobacteria bacterium]
MDAPRKPPRGPFRAVVFDLDGTLVDSAPDIATALNRTLAAAGRAAVTLAAVKTMIGDGAKRLVARGFAATGDGLGEAALERHYRDFLACYEGADAVALTRPYPGVIETLALLQSEGLRLGLCTNKPAQATRDVLQQLALAPYFAAVITPEEVGAPKPDPAHLGAVLAALDAAPADAVMVGDNANDVAVARAAGTAVVAVAYGYPRMDPHALGADVLIDAMSELPAALTRLKPAARSARPAR